MRIFFTILLLCTYPIRLCSQEYEVGKSYFSENNYVEYIAGNQPIIVSVPHGGALLPSSIPDRDCANCTTVKDANTQELCREILKEFYAETGCYPHIIINLLHRKKLDANREIDEAANGNAEAEVAWNAYHDFIKNAKENIERNWGKGLFIDLHGHGHTKQRLELGYLLSTSELLMSNDALNSPKLMEGSSIRQLARMNKMNLTHADLIRGSQSFGSILEDAGYNSVPSTNDSAPLMDDDYFNGGYNVARHGSQVSGNIDGIQIECNSGVRFESEKRKAFAKALSNALLLYVKTHYFDISGCTKVATVDFDEAPIFYPNPANDVLHIDKAFRDNSLTIFNGYGQKAMGVAMDKSRAALDVSMLPEGIYYISVDNPSAKKFKFIILR